MNLPFETLLLEKYITNPRVYELTSAEEQKINKDLTIYIMDKLMRKKFRRRISDDVRKLTIERIRYSINREEPIRLVIPFGGYKHFWNSSFPEVDWAELFHLRWMNEYVSPILSAYRPGVVIEYVSEDLIISRMNNYPEDALDAYASSFESLLSWYSKYIPSNLKFAYWRIGDKYDKKSLLEAVETQFPAKVEAYNKMSLDQQDQEIYRSNRSVLFNGAEKLENKSNAVKIQRIIESRAIELAFYDVEASEDFLGEYYWNDGHICVCFSYGLSHDNDEFGDLTLQSAPGSSVDFWIGRGVVFYGNDKVRGTIVSQNQYNALKDDLVRVPIDSSFIPLRNFGTVEVAVQ